jgi:hypothetical protein
MERICPLCGNKMNQYPAIQKCEKCSEIIIPNDYMYFLIKQQQNTCGINCSWNENDENTITNEYINKNIIRKDIIDNIIQSNIFVELSNETMCEYFTLVKKSYYSDIEKKKELIDKLRKLSTSYSSNILTFNIFEYWRQKNEIDKITSALGLDSFSNATMCFEKSFEIDRSKSIDPHLDIYFENSLKGAGVECKFGESFNREFPIIKWDGFNRYLNNNTIWKGLENLKKYAEKLYSVNKQNNYFNAKQSICHILSLHKHFNEDTSRYYFIYLFYPSIFKNENEKYIAEIDEFVKYLNKDRVNFIYKNYDQLINNVSKNINKDDNNWLTYNKNRYFLLKDYFREFVKNF